MLGDCVKSTNENGRWTFLTNHAHVLICLRRDPELRLRDVAVMVGITERMVQRIVGDLEHANVVVRERIGRRNRYIIDPAHQLRHPLEEHRTVENLLDSVG
jgi:DNA-binding MarR family transcriptional regulator